MTEFKRIVIDLDGTLCELKREGQHYADVRPKSDVIEMLRRYKAKGFHITINTARNMNTHKGDIAIIKDKTLPIILAWLQEHDVPYDEVVVGRPWCGFEGFYVDDKTIRPKEFLSLSYQQIKELIK